MSKATDKVLYLCLLFFLGHTSILNHSIKYIAILFKGYISYI